MLTLQYRNKYKMILIEMSSKLFIIFLKLMNV